MLIHSHQIKRKKNPVKVEANEEKKMLLIFQSHLEISKESQDEIVQSTVHACCRSEPKCTRAVSLSCA